MKKTITLLSALLFSLALMIPSLIWADNMKHMDEGSGKKMMDKSSHGKHKDKMSSMEEGSGTKEMYDKNADHKKMEEGSGMGQKMKMQKKMEMERKMEAKHKEGS